MAGMGGMYLYLYLHKLPYPWHEDLHPCPAGGNMSRSHHYLLRCEGP